MIVLACVIMYWDSKLSFNVLYKITLKKQINVS